MIRYVDTSCFLRLAFSEPGPALPFDGTVMVTSRVTEIELFRSIDRARLNQRIDDETVARLYDETNVLLSGLTLIEMNTQVSALASRSFAVSVRALDAIHVASAEMLLQTGTDVEFWTHDDRQAQAARSRGLQVFGVKLS